MSRIHPLFFLLLVCSLFFGCKKEEMTLTVDQAKPTIVVNNITPTVLKDSLCSIWSERVIKVSTDSTITLTLQFRDDVKLSQYKIDIHHNFDCHVHPRSEPWQVLKIKDIADKEITVTEQFKIPADVSVGNYHLMILCLDAVGNEADFVEFDVKIENALDALAPIVTLTKPASDTIQITKSENIPLQGTITDNLPLNGGRWELYYYNAANEEFTALQEFFNAAQDRNYTLNTSFTLPPSIATGTYRFVLKAFDEVNNESQRSFWVVMK